MALLPGEKRLRGGGGSYSPEVGAGMGRGTSNGQGSLLGWGWLRGQQSWSNKDQLPRDVLKSTLPGPDLGQGSTPSFLPSGGVQSGLAAGSPSWLTTVDVQINGTVTDH